MCHRKGKQRVAQIATNVSQCMGNTWVYKSKNSSMSWIHHATTPLSLEENACMALAPLFNLYSSKDSEKKQMIGDLYDYGDD